ncbi:MAG TPA: hypothetical protein VEA41_04660 [Salinarimonas sp.]|nr:hypothetical protein [Salinarimonas sp.]
MTDLPSTLASLTLLAEEVKRLGDKATPGPWTCRISRRDGYVDFGIAANGHGPILGELYGRNGDSTFDVWANATFATSARAAAPLLASAVLALVEVARQLEPMVKAIDGKHIDIESNIIECDEGAWYWHEEWLSHAKAALSRLSDLALGGK